MGFSSRMIPLVKQIKEKWMKVRSASSSSWFLRISLCTFSTKWGADILISALTAFPCSFHAENIQKRTKNEFLTPPKVCSVTQNENLSHKLSIAYFYRLVVGVLVLGKDGRFRSLKLRLFSMSWSSGTFAKWTLVICDNLWEFPNMGNV